MFKAELEYQMWKKPVVGPVELEKVAQGPFVVLTYPQDIPIAEKEQRGHDFLLRQGLDASNYVLTYYCAPDSGSDRLFAESCQTWQPLGVNLQRGVVNEIYATKIIQRPHLNFPVKPEA